MSTRALGLLLLVGCTRAPVHVTSAEALRVTPTSLDFGAVYLGGSKALTLQVVNPGLQSRTVPLSLAAPFFTDATLVLGAGESRDLLVRFTPSAAGPAAATLTLDKTSVALSGAGQGDLACSAAPCHQVSFDADAGVCIDVVQPDGAACSSNCVESGSCNGGVCRGAFKACDDGNACSVDSCSETAGCLHSDVSCPEPTDPCQAAYCDPQTGCAFAPVQDGVGCGPDDCASRSVQICLNGACAMRPIPGGELCFEAVAGVAGGPGYRDGRLGEARFLQVQTFAVDPWDNVYLVDSHALRRVTPGGVVATVATAAQLGGPDNLTQVASIDHAGNVYLSGELDCGNSAFNCTRVFSPLGQVRELDCSCNDGGLSSWGARVFATRDGRVWAFDDGAVRLRQSDGGWQTISSLGDGAMSGLSNETSVGEPVFVRQTWDADAGADRTAVVALSVDGGTRTVRELSSYVSQMVFGLGPNGELLFTSGSPEDAGSCDLYEDDPGQPVRVLLELGFPCDYVSPNVFAFTGSRYWNAARSFDGGTYVFEGYGALERVEDGGLALAGGVKERTGTSDGIGADAGLEVVAGYGFFRPTYDTLIAKPDGGLLWVENYQQSLRSWTEASGVTTLRTLTGAGYSSMSLQPDGGYWAWSGFGWTVVGDDGDGGPAQAVATDAGLDGYFYSSQAVLDDTGGIWAFNPNYQGPVHIDSSGYVDVNLAYLPVRQLRDGPLLDAGFYATHGPLVRADGNIVFIDSNSVRELSNGAVVTLAGDATTGFVDGPGGPARFAFPLGLAESPAGELYVADSDNFAIRVIDAQNRVRTIGRLTDRPSAVAVAPDGTVYVLVRDALLRGR